MTMIGIRTRHKYMYVIDEFKFLPSFNV